MAAPTPPGRCLLNTFLLWPKRVSVTLEGVPCYGTEWRVRLRRQFLLTCLRSIDLVGRPAAKDRVGSIGVVVADPKFDPGFCLTAGLEGIEEDAFVFE